MASFSRNEKTGVVRIQFESPATSKKHSIRLKVSERDGRTVQHRIEDLVSAKLVGAALDGQTALWLKGINDKLRNDLATAGLCDPVQKTGLKDFVMGYIVSRTDIKARTRENLSVCANRLVKFFGADTDLRTITPEMGERFRLHLLETNAPATTGRTIKRCRQFMADAVDKKLIAKCPFKKVKVADCSNRERMRFITQADTEKIFQACPNVEWRLLVALCRYAGLRCPSEIVGLKWSDVNWSENRFWVGSPKTEHHTGREGRFVPIFKEMKPILEEAFDAAQEGENRVVTIIDQEGAAARKYLASIIKKAGLTPWPRITHNFRASRQTELCREYPIHLVSMWLGNTVLVSAKHYLSATDADFERAAQFGSQSGSQVALKTALQANVDSGEKRQESSQVLVNCQDMPTGADIAQSAQSGQTPRQGLEP